MPYMISHITQYGRKKYLPLMILHYDGPYGKTTQYRRSLYPDKTRYRLLNKARNIAYPYGILYEMTKEIVRRLGYE